MDKRMFKKTEEELQEYMTFRKRGFIMKNKKGKGSYSRKDKHKNKKQNTIWQDIEKILQQISPSKIHDDYRSLTNELEKLSTSFEWWKNERNLEVHLDPDKLVESRMKELNESKYMMESYEFVKLLEKAEQILYGIHTIYYNQYSSKKINI
jgi:stalled ribosome alternative rescue factor ArfA